jgi:hypothetical protein
MSEIETLTNEEVRVYEWERDQFVKLGLSYFEAQYAVAAGIDYHDLEVFVRNHPGCDLVTATRILA